MSQYDVAIIGMGCIFPGSGSTRAYWKTIEGGEQLFSKMPTNRWRLQAFLGDEEEAGMGAFIDGFQFPFLEYKIPPSALRGVDPAQLVILEAAREALRR